VITKIPLDEKSREAGFIYSSLNLEGNPLTLPETEKLLIENVVPQKQKIEAIEETINYKKAIEEMLTNSKNKLPLNREIILQYHAISMNGKSFAGKFRKENVFIKLNPEFITSDWKDIENKLSILMDNYLKFESSKQDISKVIEFSAFFHNEFQRIHPFIDGNSRISRLLMLHILRMHNLPVLELPLGYFDDKQFTYLVEEIVLTNLKNLNNTLNVYKK
jgi:Fic family protein